MKQGERNEKIKIQDHPCSYDEFDLAFDKANALQFRELVEVSDALMAGYASFVKKGLPGELVGVAMLAATLNLYEIFDMRADLPRVLRKLADRIDHSSAN